MSSPEREELREREDPAISLHQTPKGIEVKEKVAKLHSESDYAVTHEAATDTDFIYEVDILIFKVKRQCKFFV